jgi:hypothetical protein
MDIPVGLVKIDAPDTLQGWCLVEEGSDAHKAAQSVPSARKPKSKD